MTEHDIERRQALCELLTLPDPPHIRRGFIMRFEGKPDRHQLLQHVTAMFVQSKLLAQHERTAVYEDDWRQAGARERDGQVVAR